MHQIHITKFPRQPAGEDAVPNALSAAVAKMLTMSILLNNYRRSTPLDDVRGAER